MTFSERLDSLMQEQNVQKNTLAQLVNISTQTFYDWKKKGTVPSADVAVKIASFLGTTVEYLITGKETDSFKEKYENLKASMLNVIQNN